MKSLDKVEFRNRYSFLDNNVGRHKDDKGEKCVAYRINKEVLNNVENKMKNEINELRSGY